MVTYTASFKSSEAARWAYNRLMNHYRSRNSAGNTIYDPTQTKIRGTVISLNDNGLSILEKILKGNKIKIKLSKPRLN